jgi:glyoxylase-like metal-dependent hydrolase (beta-lactamase superfamily II)
MRFLPIVLALAALRTLSGQQPEIPRGFTADTLAPGVVAFVRREPLGYGNEANSLLIVGSRYAAVVDAQLLPSDTREVIAAIRTITTKPVRYVVNTHCHDDHVTGNVEYQKAFPGVDFVSSRVMADEMNGICAKNRASFRSSAATPGFLRDLVAKGQSLAGGPMPDDERDGLLSYARLVQGFIAESDEKPIAPTKTFEGKLTLDLGGRSIDVLYLGRGHSAGDVVVHVADAGVLAAGDLVMWPVPFVGTTSFPGDFAQTLDKMLALHPRAILPGHGPLLSDTMHVHQVSRMLKSIRDQVATSVARGDSLRQTRAAVDLSEFRTLFGGSSKLRQGLFDQYVKSSAIPAEFKAQRKQ